ncbi:MAG TPA: zinc ribbon domain-containing protein [Solirubrobacteraceae bacterium]|nr:zinc ribbon domain-containing protein [Solirubrobacteraceae bacterium]
MTSLAILGVESAGLKIAVDLLVLALVVLYLALIYWTYNDARRRIADPMLVGCATVASLFPFIGTLVYVVLRPPEYLDDALERDLDLRAAQARERELEHLRCPHCEYPTERDFLLCPNCQRKLKEPCPSCSRPIEPTWSTCPYCATEVQAATRTTTRRRTRRTKAPAAPAAAAVEEANGALDETPPAVAPAGAGRTRRQRADA